MFLATTLAAGGTRPASFLPSIKCSSCGDEIEISAMGDHVCAKVPQTPESPQSTQASLSNPFTLRAMNASGSKPAQPSPLQFDAPSPQTRARAPTAGSIQMAPTRAPRPAPPRINADVANTPFLAPIPRSETPISPATSTRSGSSFGGKSAPLRSMTSPMPRLWDPRPPSPELSANLDCAFPPFPFSDTGGSRPSTSSGRRTPAGSERASSRASSRQGSRFQDTSNTETQSSAASAGESVIDRMNILKSGQFDPSHRRPSKDDGQQQDLKPLDRRCPSLPKDLMSGEPDPLPSVSRPNLSQISQPPVLKPVSYGGSKSSMFGSNSFGDKKSPPERPVRPTESLTPLLLDKLSAEPVSPLSPTFPPPPLAPLRNADRSQTYPALAEDKGEPAGPATLSRMRSEPALRSKAQRPVLPSTTPSEPTQIASLPKRGRSRNETRVDHRLQDAPPVPKPVQLHRSDSRHRPSGSDSSSVSSLNSRPNTNSSSGPSPATSAASIIDAFPPLANELRRNEEDQAMLVAGLSFKNPVQPGMRAEQRKDRSPQRDFSRPSPPKEIALPVMESPIITSSSNWPLESPMDPAMQNGKLGSASEPRVQLIQASTPTPKAVLSDFDLDFNLSPDTFSSDEYDPYRSTSPLPTALHTRTRSKTNTEASYKPSELLASSRSQTTQPKMPKPSTQDTSRSQTVPPRPPQVPPMPECAPRPQLTRRPTVGGKPNCRGCGLQIEGKSVKAADGRLTGRWHKACFVCKTCEQPFTTADFYVHKNNPYCEQHYHEKNGSMCHGCHRGIEGQYTETSSSSSAGRVERKYHPRCFTCFNCRMVLAEDYFEIEGRVFCERHALAAMRAQPKVVNPGGSSTPPGKSGRSGLPPPHGSSGLRAERRTTKLMMMS